MSSLVGAPVKEEELGVTLVSDIDIFNAQSTMTAMSIILWEGRTSTGCQFVKEEGQGKSSGTENSEAELSSLVPHGFCGR